MGRYYAAEFILGSLVLKVLETNSPLPCPLFLLKKGRGNFETEHTSRGGGKKGRMMSFTEREQREREREREVIRYLGEERMRSCPLGTFVLTFEDRGFKHPYLAQEEQLEVGVRGEEVEVVLVRRRVLQLQLDGFHDVSRSLTSQLHIRCTAPLSCLNF